MLTHEQVVDDEINKIVSVILSEVPALEIYLFGSFVNGTANSDSDYDFYVVVPDNLQPIETTWLINGAIRKNMKKTRRIDMLVGVLLLFWR